MSVRRFQLTLKGQDHSVMSTVTYIEYVFAPYLMEPLTSPYTNINLGETGCRAKDPIDSFHILSVHAPNCLIPRYLRKITRVLTSGLVL